jgi:hypothetical protein
LSAQIETNSKEVVTMATQRSSEANKAGKGTKHLRIAKKLEATETLKGTVSGTHIPRVTIQM